MRIFRERMHNYAYMRNISKDWSQGTWHFAQNPEKNREKTPPEPGACPAGEPGEIFGKSPMMDEMHGTNGEMGIDEAYYSGKTTKESEKMQKFRKNLQG